MKSKRAREAAEVDETPINDVAAEAPVKKRKRSDDDVDADENAVKKVSKKDKKDSKKKDKKKKDQKESRKERKEKRKDLQNLPGEEDEDEQADEAEETVAEKIAEAEVNSKKEKKDKKKDKKEKKEKTAETNGAADEKSAAVNGETSEKKSKKNKKQKKDTTTEQPTADAEPTKENGEDGIDLDADTAGKQDRHIVFVGNLPYTATAATISAHFASLSPIAVRCLKNKGDDKPCRGIAFVEFGKVWHMRTCLDKFHHSVFEDGVSPARKINVELTAGGGGKTKQRQDKIREKNKKLEENRFKRIEKEKLAKTENGGGGGGGAEHNIEDSVHPSRRARVPGMNY